MKTERTAPETGNVVAVKNLTMVYQLGKVEVPALRRLDVVIQRGEFVALMGPSGCGKSTLLHLVGGLLKPTSGQIWIDGLEIGSVSDAERTRIRGQKIGFVFQSYNLLSSLTARDNIQLAKEIHGNHHHRERSVSQILQMLALGNKMNHRPSQLSGGEQQRVAIARAVIHQPSILLADEPTGSLDSDSSKMVLDLLQSLNVEYAQTIMMVTHDPEAARRAHRLIEIRDGKVLKVRPGKARTPPSFFGSPRLVPFQLIGGMLSWYAVRRFFKNRLPLTVLRNRSRRKAVVPVQTRLEVNELEGQPIGRGLRSRTRLLTSLVQPLAHFVGTALAGILDRLTFRARRRLSSNSAATRRP